MVLRWLGSGGTNASASPLVIIAQRAGVPVLPHIINAVLLTAVLSAANSNVYSSSRILIALAEDGLAPAVFKRTNRYGTPYYAVAFCSILGLLGFLPIGLLFSPVPRSAIVFGSRRFWHWSDRFEMQRPTWAAWPKHET